MRSLGLIVAGLLLAGCQRSGAPESTTDAATAPAAPARTTAVAVQPAVAAPAPSEAGKPVPAPKKTSKPVLVLDSGGHTRGVIKILFTPDDREIITVSWDKTVGVWSVATGERTHAGTQRPDRRRG